MNIRKSVSLHPLSIQSWIANALVLALVVASASLSTMGGRPAIPQNSDESLDLRIPRLPFREVRGAVYAMTNEAEGNRIAVYSRFIDGTLGNLWYVPTGGLGSGGKPPLEPVDALGSQSPLILSKDGRWLFAVNAGSDEISVFEVIDGSLRLTDVTHSGGPFPVSLTFDGETLYVLNSGGQGNISGFRLDGDGRLNAIDGSTRNLGVSGVNPPFFLVSPAQIGFSPLGDFLLVTVKGSDSVYTYPVRPDGMVGETPLVSPSFGKTPFGFVFDRRGNLIIVEPFGQGTVGEARVSAVSSYRLQSDGSTQLISGSVDNLQTATCWIAILPSGRFAYVTNNASDTVTGYQVNRLGELSLLDSDGVSAHTGHAPVDIASSADGRFIYTVNAGDGTVSMFAVNPRDGSLAELGSVRGLPVEDGAVGIAAR